MTESALNTKKSPEIAPSASFWDYLRTLPQYLLPQHPLSRAVHGLTRLRAAWFKNRVIHWFIRRFQVDMSETLATREDSYEHFNAFFTRALRPDARPLPTDARMIASPVDGRISEIGDIHRGRLLQAKGKSFNLHTLLGGSAQWSEVFEGGSFATIYLSPRDYHRIHMPMDGELQETIYVPGRLFAVNQSAVKVVNGLFARNERVVSLFRTPAGPMAMVSVGALFVGSIETVWAGEITPPQAKHIELRNYPEGQVRLARGEEMGRFNMGSTVILLFAAGRVAWDPRLAAGQAVRMGEAVGNVLT